MDLSLLFVVQLPLNFMNFTVLLKLLYWKLLSDFIDEHDQIGLKVIDFSLGLRACERVRQN